jgi:hypothetical protein
VAANWLTMSKICSLGGRVSFFLNNPTAIGFWFGVQHLSAIPIARDGRLIVNDLKDLFVNLRLILIEEMLFFSNLTFYLFRFFFRS